MPGYPWLPALVILFNLFYLVVTVINDVNKYLDGKARVMHSVFGIVVVAMGVPLYFYFKRRYKTVKPAPSPDLSSDIQQKPA